MGQKASKLKKISSLSHAFYPVTATRPLLEKGIERQKEALNEGRSGKPYEVGIPPQIELLPGLPMDELAVLCLAHVPRATVPVLRAVCKRWRHLVDKGELQAVREEYNLGEAWIYSLEWGREEPDGYHPRLWAFDTAASKWRNLGPLPAMAGLLPSCRIAAIGSLLIFHGGARPLDDFERFFPVCEVWGYDTWHCQTRQLRSMHTPRDRFAAAVIGGRLFVAGGITTGWSYAHTALLSVEMYDPVTDTWTNLPDLPSKPARLCTLERQGGALGGKFFVRGSWVEGQAVDIFDPEAGAWNTIEDWFPPDAGPPFYTRVVDGGAGEHLHLLEFTEALEGWTRKFDAGQGTWSSIDQLPVRGSAASVSFADVGGKVYVIGGKPQEDPAGLVGADRPSYLTLRGARKQQAEPYMHTCEQGSSSWHAVCPPEIGCLPKAVRGDAVVWS